MRDDELAYFSELNAEPCPYETLIGSSCTYRLAFGPHQGKKVLTLQTLPEVAETSKKNDLVAETSGFSLHARVLCQAGETKKLERLCRYIARSAVSEQRLSLNTNGQVVYKLKTAYTHGSTHSVMSPLEFLGRLAALVPRPGMNLIRFHGIFAPNFKHRDRVVPSEKLTAQKTEQTTQVTLKSKAMGWAKRLKPVFNIDIEICPKCAGQLKVIACIEDPVVIDKMLTHPGLKPTLESHPARAPPMAPLDNFCLV